MKILEVLKELAMLKLNLYCERMCADDIWKERRMAADLEEWRKAHYEALLIAYGQ